MAPPELTALLPEKTLSLTVSTAWLKFEIAPPVTPLLPEKLLLATVNVPPFRMAPTSEWPLAMVRLRNSRSAPGITDITRRNKLPLIVTVLPPSIVSLPAR
ncbi:hypothetical protein HRbin30_03154 [bacterium HR30]|nr:hypothetical protein HRbin30_03154 [bacterium HR30]